MNSRPAGQLAAQAGSGDSTITVTDSSRIGVGDVVICESERMLVTDYSWVNTGVAFTGLSTAKASDKMAGVPDGTQFHAGEVLLVDIEWMLIEAVLGNNLVVKRAWEGSLLSEHSPGTLWARRVLSVLRGAVGTTTAAHTSSSALAVAEVPGLIRQLSVAEALVELTQETGGYGGASSSSGAGSGGGNQSPSGPGLPDLREQVCCSRYTRHARIRAV
jgi:hypothetical protein